MISFDVLRCCQLYVATATTDYQDHFGECVGIAMLVDFRDDHFVIK